MTIIIFGAIVVIILVATVRILAGWFLPAHVAAGLGRAIGGTFEFVGKLSIVLLCLGIIGLIIAAMLH
ncbi:hypothetical protein [Ancylobacter amanitiformis]|uniref:Tic20 family protein n=1 Tax=Ancylobacter amanitiformis TaxID=217069 RepID=A0ABU0LQQ0_9HYPH|nr:hypothetical protein [Ancylobacter amanitiformis]MDQ0510913.1 putative Tic20 family protein [Ancylobacter amanitiformis]